MLIREKILLNIVKHSGGSVSRIHLVKTAFIFSQTYNIPKLNSFYQFIPFKYGPFSFTMYHELKSLIDYGYLIKQPDSKLGISDNVHLPDIDYQLECMIKPIVVKFRKYTQSALLKKVYSQYPWYTINAEKPESRLKSRPVGDIAIYTIGYEGLQIDSFLNILLHKGIQRLIDIRSNPVSRKYGFHKSRLSSLSRHLNIEYIHIPEVGIPSSWRENIDNTNDYKRLFKRYAREILPNQKDSLDTISNLIKTKPSALFCMEENPDYCHRSVLAEKLSELIKIPVCELRN